MSITKRIEPPERMELVPLFADHRRWRVVIDAVLQGYCGSAEAEAQSAAQVAKLTLGPFAIFGGDPAHPAARDMVRGVPAKSTLIFEDAWRDIVRRTHSKRLKPIQRFVFSSEALDFEYLRSFMTRTPKGFHIERINADLAQRIGAEVGPYLVWLAAFNSPADFVERGIGFCAMAGDQIVCGATSAVVCDGAIGIQVNTNEPFRRKGLATAVCATLIAHCLGRGINPAWDADNSISVRLAEKLGYVLDDTYEVWSLS